jgi:hypothetical protein
MFAMNRGKRPSFAEQGRQHARALKGRVLGDKNRGWKPSRRFRYTLAEGANAAQRRSNHEHSTFHN